MHPWILISIERGVSMGNDSITLDKLVYLRAFELEDEDFLIHIRKNKDVFSLTTGNKYFASKEHSKKLLKDNLISDGKNLYLMICLTEENSPIGYLSIVDIDHVNKKAQWGGIIIDSSYSGKGYATIAAKEMLKFIFEDMNMNKVYGYWLDSNLASLKMSQKLGFVEEGVLRDHIFKGNQYHAVYYLSILRSEYFKHIDLGVQ